MSADQGSASRPFRLIRKGLEMRWKCYQYRDNAKWGALREAKQSPVGTVVEVRNVETGNTLQKYRREQKSISWS